ncbi:MAG: ATP-binding cassette domain-containing protein [Bryobacteraceae bacterium]
MPLVEFRNVVYEITGKTILSGMSFGVEEGETLVLVGRSGSGKSTALKLTNGMLFPTSGEVLVDGRRTTDWDPIALKRRTGYVIQEVGLFPHFTVARNVGLIPRLEGWQESDIERRVDHLLATVGLDSREYGNRYPRQLSGGQRQRVGVARALGADPPLLLFDEPFGALDPVTRSELQQQFLGWQRDFHKTSIFVTHDIREAMRLGNRIALLANGKLEVLTPAAEFPNATTPEARAFLASL